METATPTTDGVIDLETLFVDSGSITQKDLDRARRVASRMKKPKPIGEILVELGQLSRSEYDRIVRLYRSSLTLVQILREDGALDDDCVTSYEEARTETPERSERQLLVESGWVEEEAFLRALATKYDIPLVEPEAALIDTDLLSKVSIPYLSRQKVAPFRIVDGALNVLMADPLNEELRKTLEEIFEVPIKPCGAMAEKIVAALKTLEKWRHSSGEDPETALQYRVIQDIADEEEAGEGAVGLVDYVLSRAIEMGASDIHIEPRQTKLRIRARVDGAMHLINELPADLTPRLISRLKVLGSVDIAERRLHQDGRIFVKFESREVDIRLSTYVSVFGESIVLRLLDRSKGLLPVDSLGFHPNVLSMLRDVGLRSSSGLILVTGPTGSGKTTTLYSFVDHLLDDDVKVITCEDPVEYVLEGVTQCSVNQKKGPTFADSLRAILRQDPDVIVVGEIRDKLTASLAVEAALTGHLVMSTFHTEDAVGAVVRLLEMGVEPFLVSSTLNCVVAQRLIRRICPDCREPAQPTRRDTRFLGRSRDELADATFYGAGGCDECGGSGYKGRIGIHEVLMPDDDFRDAMLRRAPSKELKALAKALPAYLTLQEVGLINAIEGHTSLDAVVHSAPRDVTGRSIPAIHEIAFRRRGG